MYRFPRDLFVPLQHLVSRWLTQAELGQGAGHLYWPQAAGSVAGSGVTLSLFLLMT